MKHEGDAVPLLGHVKAPTSLCGSMGDAGATAGTVRASLDGQSVPGQAAHRRMGRASPRRCRRDAAKEANFGCAPCSKCNYVKVTEEEMKLGVVIRKEK